MAMIAKSIPPQESALSTALRRAGFIVCAAGFALSLVAAPALADPHRHGHDDHGHFHRDWHHHDERGYGGGYYPPPPVVYGSPYYAPPPVVYGPGIGLNIHIP